MPRITTKGQVTIPKEARDALGLQAGGEVEFVLRPGELVLRKASIRQAIEGWAGYLNRGGPDRATEQDMDELRGPVEP